MQSESSRELPDMIHEIRENVNSQVSFHVLYIFHSIAASHIQKGDYSYS